MQAIDIIISFWAFVFGAVFASFAGVVVFRVPKGQSIVKPDSYCPFCFHKLGVLDNIPIFGYLFLLGKCRYCKARIPFFGFVCEILGGVGFVGAYLSCKGSLKLLPEMIALLLMIFLFLVIAGIDHDTQYIYNITLVLFAVLSTALAVLRIMFRGESVWSCLGGALLGFVFFGCVSIFSRVILKKDALGTGDIWLVGIAGFMLGALEILFAIVIATTLGSVIELIKIKLKRSTRESEIAFAPYLLLGIGAMAVFGRAITDVYWRIFL